ncbi:MAG: hypothetical protein EOP82_11680 [Variovorax sp.]|nr:MAG: hypothetical protein EOP82_11680 [Variovorax sp.]
MLNFQPVIPISVNSDWNVITRTIILGYWSTTSGRKQHFFAPSNNGLIQYFVNYNLPGGLYFTTSPINTVNWKAQGGQKWTVPLGGGVGKIFHFGKLPVNMSLSAYYNVVRPDNAANWQVRFQAQFMFPK